MNTYSAVKAFVLMSLLGIALAANASVVSCTAPGTMLLVDYASACQRSLSATQDFLNFTPTTVNQEAFYGYTDWQFLKKDDPAGNGQTGVWSLTNNEWTQYSNIMLIFKDGSGTTLLGFALTPSFTNGNWSSPFTADEFTNLCDEDDCNKIKDVSHISYYARGDIVHVSEPASLLLMLIGVLGLRIARRQIA